MQRRHRRALGPQTGRKNTVEEEKRKGAARLMARFDPIPASPKWMIADYLWLSVQVRNNCSFCEYLTGDICFNCSFGTNLQPSLSETIVFLFFFFPVFMKADVIIFAMFAQASLYGSSTETRTLLYSPCRRQSLLKTSALYYYGKETTHSAS